MERENKALDILTNYILDAIEKKTKNLLCDKEALIIKTNSEKNTCTVLIDGQQYSAKNGTNITFVNGDKCLVHYINGNQQKKIIIAKL